MVYLVLLITKTSGVTCTDISPVANKKDFIRDASKNLTVASFALRTCIFIRWRKAANENHCLLTTRSSTKFNAIFFSFVKIYPAQLSFRFSVFSYLKYITLATEERSSTIRSLSSVRLGVGQRNIKLHLCYNSLTRWSSLYLNTQ